MHDEPTAARTSQWAHNSVVECHLHTVEVEGSNPSVPTTLRTKSSKPANGFEDFFVVAAHALSICLVLA